MAIVTQPTCHTYRKEGEPTWYSIVMVREDRLETTTEYATDNQGFPSRPLNVRTYTHHSTRFDLKCKNCGELTGSTYKTFEEAKLERNKANRGL